MHKFVALIANSESQDSFDQVTQRLSRRFTDWRCVLDSNRAKAWVAVTPQSTISFTPRSPAGCLIGVELGNRGPTPWDKAVGNAPLSGSWGAFVAILVGEGTEVTISRDPSGRIPCWTGRLSGADVYFSNIDDVPEAAQAHTDCIDWDYIQYHLNTRGDHGRQTGLIAVTELLPGRQVRYSGGTGKETSAWRIADIIACPYESPEAAEAGLRAAAAEAVAAWARRYDSVALELSGGFDSAVVLGLLREQAPDTHVLGINYLIAHPEGDERTYAQEAADHHGISLMVEHMSAQGNGFDLDRPRNRLRPNFQSLPLGYAEALARAANTIDAQAVFTGTGGDHVFGQLVPSSMVAEAVQDRLALPKILSIAHNHAKMSADTFWNVSWSATKELWHPSLNPRKLLQSSNPYLTNDCIETVNYDCFAHPDLLEVGDLVSSAKLKQIITFHELNEFYARYGPNVKLDEVNPLQSQLVLEASLRIPSYWMNPAGRMRGLARRAFRDLVPDAILTRRGKSSNTSLWLQVLANNIPFLRELMLDGHLVRRRFLDRKKLEIDLSHERLLTKADFTGLVRSITTELWVQCYASGIDGSAHDNRLKALV